MISVSEISVSFLTNMVLKPAHRISTANPTRMAGRCSLLRPQPTPHTVQRALSEREKHRNLKALCTECTDILKHCHALCTECKAGHWVRLGRRVDGLLDRAPACLFFGVSATTVGCDREGTHTWSIHE